MRYSDDIKQELLARNNIVDIIGERVALKRSGSDYVGLCPFHHEKTPSFNVSERKQMYYCFGCHAGGNVITFLMDYEKLTFVESLRFLADRAGMELPEEQLTPEEKAASDKKHNLLTIYKHKTRDLIGKDLGGHQLDMGQLAGVRGTDSKWPRLSASARKRQN